MTDRQHFGDSRHRQAVLVCLANRFVAVVAQCFRKLLELGLTAAMLSRECHQCGARFRCFALGARNTGDRQPYYCKSVCTNLSPMVHNHIPLKARVLSEPLAGSAK